MDENCALFLAGTEIFSNEFEVITIAALLMAITVGTFLSGRRKPEPGESSCASVFSKDVRPGAKLLGSSK